MERPAGCSGTAATALSRTSPPRADSRLELQVARLALNDHDQDGWPTSLSPTYTQPNKRRNQRNGTFKDVALAAAWPSAKTQARRGWGSCRRLRQLGPSRLAVTNFEGGDGGALSRAGRRALPGRRAAGRRRGPSRTRLGSAFSSPTSTGRPARSRRRQWPHRRHRPHHAANTGQAHSAAAVPQPETGRFVMFRRSPRGFARRASGADWPTATSIGRRRSSLLMTTNNGRPSFYATITAPATGACASGRRHLVEPRRDCATVRLFHGGLTQTRMSERVELSVASELPLTFGVGRRDRVDRGGPHLPTEGRGVRQSGDGQGLRLDRSQGHPALGAVNSDVHPDCQLNRSPACTRRRHSTIRPTTSIR